MLGAVVSEAVVFGFVSEHIKTSKVVVLGVKGVESVCLASDMSEIAAIFFVGFGDVVLAPLLEVDLVLLGAIEAEGKLEELERADVVVLDTSALK